MADFDTTPGQPKSRREVVLSVRFSSHNDNIEPSLTPGPKGRVGDFPADQFIGEARHIIESDLPRELRDVFGLKVETRVIAVRGGSIIIYFGAAIAGLATFSRYKSLVESIDLLRRHLDRLLGRLAQKYSGNIRVDVGVEFPRLDNPGDWHWRWRKWMRDPEDEMMASMMMPDDGNYRLKRDGFFWFLLLLCTFETAALVLLVWKAMSKMYFP